MNYFNSILRFGVFSANTEFPIAAGPCSLWLPAARRPRRARLVWSLTPLTAFLPQRKTAADILGAGDTQRGGAVPLTAPPPSTALPGRPPVPRRAGKMAAAGRAWRAAALLPPWRLRAPRRAYGGGGAAAAAAAAAAGGGGGRLLLGAAFALGGGAGLYLAARQRLREHSAAEVTRRRAPLAASGGLPPPPAGRALLPSRPPPSPLVLPREPALPSPPSPGEARARPRLRASRDGASGRARSGCFWSGFSEETA